MQRDLFDKRTKLWREDSERKSKRDRIREKYEKQYGKLTLRKERIVERNFVGQVEQYGNLPLFYGLPNMGAWLLWKEICRVSKLNKNTS